MKQSKILEPIVDTDEFSGDLAHPSRRLSQYPGYCPICGRGGEPPVPLSVAAKELALPVSKIRRASKANVFPTYRLHDSRTLCFVSDVRDAILNSRKDGGL